MKFEAGNFYLPHFPLKVQRGKSEAPLLHYKFLLSDIDKFDEFIKSGVHSDNSSEYIIYEQYIRKHGVDFLDGASKEYSNAKVTIAHFSKFL